MNDHVGRTAVTRSAVGNAPPIDFIRNEEPMRPAFETGDPILGCKPIGEPLVRSKRMFRSIHRVTNSSSDQFIE